MRKRADVVLRSSDCDVTAAAAAAPAAAVAVGKAACVRRDAGGDAGPA